MSGKVWNYVYNSENQMTEAHYFEGPSKLKSVSFFYDALGRRVKKAVEDFQTGNTYARKYAYDSNEIIAELDEANNVLATYTHSGLRTDDVLSAEITSSGAAKGLAQVAGTYMYLKDGLGSVQAITTESGQLVQRYIYSSFGKLLKIVDAIGLETTAIKTAFTYTNREIDEETGLYYYRARYYDAHSGRFMQEDPHPGRIISPQTFNNTHTYVNNNPAGYVDPSGKIKISLNLKDINRLGTNLWKSSVDVFTSREAQMIYGLGGAALFIAGGAAATAAGFPQAGTVLIGAGIGMAVGSVGGYLSGSKNVIADAAKGAAYDGAVTLGAVAGAAFATSIISGSSMSAFAAGSLKFGATYIGASFGSAAADWMGANIAGASALGPAVAAGAAYYTGGTSGGSSGASSGGGSHGYNVFNPN